MLDIPPLPCWLAVHREVRSNRRIREVYDFLARGIAELAHRPDRVSDLRGIVHHHDAFSEGGSARLDRPRAATLEHPSTRLVEVGEGLVRRRRDVRPAHERLAVRL